MKPVNNDIILNKQVGVDELITGIHSHGFLFPLVAKSMVELVNLLNGFKTPIRIVNIFFGEGRYNAIIEMDRRFKKVKKQKKTKSEVI